MTDDLDIPPFLRRKPGVQRETATPETVTAASAKEFLEPWQIELAKIEPPEFRAYVEEKMRQGRFARRWLVPRDPAHTTRDVDLTVQHFRAKFEERAARVAASAEAAKKRLETVREMSPTHGMVPLRKILEEMGDAAPRRSHAKTAIDEAKLEHVRYHFPRGSPVIIARVRQVLAEFAPPERGAKPEFDENLIMRWSGKNPKKEGTDAYARWEKLRKHDGRTVGQFLADDGNPTTLRNALTRGSVKLEESKNKCQSEKKTRTSSPSSSTDKETRRRGQTSRGRSSGQRAKSRSSTRRRS